MTDAKRAGHRWSNAAPTLGPYRLHAEQPLKTAQNTDVTGFVVAGEAFSAPKRAPGGRR